MSKTVRTLGFLAAAVCGGAEPYAAEYCIPQPRPPVQNGFPPYYSPPRGERFGNPPVAREVPRTLDLEFHERGGGWASDYQYRLGGGIRGATDLDFHFHEEPAPFYGYQPRYSPPPSYGCCGGGYGGYGNGYSQPPSYGPQSYAPSYTAQPPVPYGGYGNQQSLPPGWGTSVYGLHPAPLPFQRWLLRRRLTEGALHSW